MSSELESVGSAEQLREAFDAGFRERPAPRQAPHENVLALRIDGSAYVIRLAEVSSLHARPVLTRVPSAVPELIGVVAVRGALVPAYDLGLLLGRGALASARWLVIVKGESPVGLAFAELEGHLRIDRDPGAARETGSPDDGTAEALRIRGSVWPVISIRDLMAAITRRSGKPLTKEQSR